MLVLGHEEGQEIRIGEKVIVRVFTHRGRLKVGIDAPKEMLIIRRESTIHNQEQSNHGKS